jgi:hypothetical protein
MDPSLFDTTQSPFLFAIGITGVNLNDPTTKYFNIQFSQKTTDSVNGKSTTNFNLQPCQKQDWVRFNP